MLFNKVKKKIIKRIREPWFNLNYALFGHIPALPLNERGVRTLIYHGVCKKDALKFNARFLTEKQFENHLVAIKKCFNPLSFEDFKNNNLSSNKLNVLLTFDDGLKNNYEYALPLLLKHQIPAVFFITTLKDRSSFLFNDLLDVFSFVGPEAIKINGVEFTKQKSYSHYRYKNRDGIFLSTHFHATNNNEREEIMKQIFAYTLPEQFMSHREYLALMDEDEIKKLASLKDMTVASHGVSHTDFTVIGVEELMSELQQSQEALEKITEKKCELMAFPYGNYDQNTLTACKKQGYKYIFGTEKLQNQADRAMVIERFTINPFISAINQMYYIAKNNYE